MRIPVEFWVPGEPKPGGSKRAIPLFAGKGPGRVWKRNVVTDASGEKGKDWRATVKLFASQACQGMELAECPLRAEFLFVVLRPKGHSGKRGLKPSAPKLPVKKPDVLKLARAVEDSLTGIVYKDDSQIVTEVLKKRYGTHPGVRVRISEEIEE